MDARIQPLPFEPSSLRGLSERLVSSDHQNNYGGSVKRLNAIRAQLAGLGLFNAPGFRLNGLKREDARYLSREIDGGTKAGRALVDKPRG